MATALIGGLKKSGVAAQSIVVVDPNEDQLKRLEKEFGIQTTLSSQAATEAADVVVWAVKPQVLHDAANHVNAPHALHISIAAGISSSNLVKWLKTDRVVRAMPNTPALVGKGVTGLFAATGVNPVDKNVVEDLFSGTGYAFWVKSDDNMNAVTAISGSGPAYVFHFLEGFQRAALALGFHSDQARELALMVARGAVEQAISSNESLSTLREKVTSERGTTEAALSCLDAAHTQEALREAVLAAENRARELSLELSQ